MVICICVKLQRETGVSCSWQAYISMKQGSVVKMSHLNKKLFSTGAAVITLRAFVPNPFMIGEAMAQATVSDTMNITANVVNPLKVTEVTKFNFGSFAVSAVAGSRVVPANGGAVVMNNGVDLGANVLGKVTIKAPQNASFTIEIAALATKSIVIKNGTGGSSKKTMKVEQLTLNASTKMKLGGVAGGSATFIQNGNTNTSAVIVHAGGVATAAIGGILNFKPTQLVGSYTGTYALVTSF